ncbi:MAG: hypothetical protein FWC09_02530 [Lachnospiraceae bacterium]|nr:hypothetical protein [Lachnospiraceae bacterium]
MNIFRRIFRHFRKEYEYPEQFDVWEEVVYNRNDIDLRDPEQLSDYVTNCLEQIKEASGEIDSLSSEYNIVTSQLKDMEEIEALPADDRRALCEAATRLTNINTARKGFEKKVIPMNEADFNKIDALYDQIEEGVRKLKEAEIYKTKIKQDMKHLSGEKEAYVFRKYDLQHFIEDLRSMIVICLTAAFLCVAILLILQFGFGMNTQIGYLLAAGATAVAMTFVYLKHTNALHELKRVEKSINKIILLHNSVKIRYINNTNLLEYLHIKYNVKNAAELEKKFLQYLAEKKRREEFKQMEKDLDAAERDLLRILRSIKLTDPHVWLHQPAAILDKKEMVEVRHNLIIRRQTLRKRMDYNKEVVAKKAQDEIKDLVDQYPDFSAKIMGMIDKYEEKYS